MTIRRNDPCWCGSGRKYKQCHWKQDQAESAERAAKQREREARIEALGRPSDAEMRERFQGMTGQAPPPGPLTREVRDMILEVWQQERMAEIASEELAPHREELEAHFAGSSDEFDTIARELAADPFFKKYELTSKNVRKVRETLGELPPETEPEARQRFIHEALTLSLDEDDREMFHKALRSRMLPLVDDGNYRGAYVVERCAAGVLDPETPPSPFLERVVLRSLGQVGATA